MPLICPLPASDSILHSWDKEHMLNALAMGPRVP